MSGYLKNITMQEQFDGDAVTAVMRPLALGTMLGVRAAASGGEAALAQEFQRILPGQIVSLTGLRDAAGEEIDVATLCSAAYFLPLVMALATHLVTEASPKNAPPPSAP